MTKYEQRLAELKELEESVVDDLEADETPDSDPNFVVWKFGMERPTAEQEEEADEDGLVWECIEEEEVLFESKSLDEAIYFADHYNEAYANMYCTIITIETVISDGEGGTVNIGTTYSRKL